MAIFVPSLINEKSKEASLSKTLKDVGLEAVVFSKYTEFQNYMDKFSPPFAVCPNIACKNISQKGGALHKINSRKSSYLVLSSKKMTNDDLAKVKWGMVQLGPRESQMEMLSGAIKGKVRFLKTVAKEEDLVPLLVFNTVEAVLISEEGMKRNQGKFNVKLQQHKDPLTLEGEELYSKDKNPEGLQQVLTVLKKEMER